MGVTAVVSDNLFLAIRPDESAAARVFASGAALRALHGLRGKLIAPERLHITLHFVGDFDVVLAERAAAAVCSVRARPFDIILDRALSFSHRSQKRPFVLASTGPSQELKDFRKQLAAALLQAGLRTEPRSFTLHLTLLYDEQIVKEHLIEPIRWTVQEFVLVHSFVGRSRHETLGHWPLVDGGWSSGTMNLNW